MPVPPSTPIATPGLSLSAGDIIRDALQEIGVLAQGEPISDADAQFALGKLNRMLDQWNSRRLLIWNVSFDSYTIIPNQQPHTIGPTGADFTVAIRPLKIENAAIVLNNVVPNVKNPLNLRDDDWWAANLVPGITSTLPTDLYYSPGWPNGSIYLWPVPTVAYLLQLETRTLIANFTDLVNAVTFPPGYANAVVTNLALQLCPSFGATASPVLAAMAQKALADIEANNTFTPSLATCDNGLSSPGKALPSWNWLTGQPS